MKDKALAVSPQPNFLKSEPSWLFFLVLKKIKCKFEFLQIMAS